MRFLRFLVSTGFNSSRSRIRTYKKSIPIRTKSVSDTSPTLISVLVPDKVRGIFFASYRSVWFRSVWVHNPKPCRRSSPINLELGTECVNFYFGLRITWELRVTLNSALKRLRSWPPPGLKGNRIPSGEKNDTSTLKSSKLRMVTQNASPNLTKISSKSTLVHYKPWISVEIRISWNSEWSSTFGIARGFVSRPVFFYRVGGLHKRSRNSLSGRGARFRGVFGCRSLSPRETACLGVGETWIFSVARIIQYDTTSYDNAVPGTTIKGNCSRGCLPNRRSRHYTRIIRSTSK